MRLVDLTRMLPVAALLAASAATLAQPVAPAALPAPAPATPGSMPTAGALPATTATALAADTAPAPTESLARKARNVAIGKTDGEANATLQELLKLQQQQYLQELRAKMAEPGPAMIGGPVAGTVPGAPPVLPAVVPTIPDAAPLPSEASMPQVNLNPEPEARVVSIIVSSGRGRADVMTNGVVTTVKEGDKLGEWTVTAVRLDGVTVETTVSGKRPDPDFKPSKAKKRGRSAKPPMIDFENVVVAKLKMAPPEALGVPVAAAAAAATAAQPASAVIPPLPAPIRPVDSASIPPAAPLN